MTSAGRDKRKGQARNGKGKFVRTIESAERDAEACRMRTRGRTLREIAETLGYSDPSVAHRAISKVLNDTVQESADELRKLELDRLDMMWSRTIDVLERMHITVSNGRVVYVDEEPLQDDGPVLAAVDRLVKIQDRRARLLGLDAPAKVESDAKVRYVIDGLDMDKLT